MLSVKSINSAHPKKVCMKFLSLTIFEGTKVSDFKLSQFQHAPNLLHRAILQSGVIDTRWQPMAFKSDGVSAGRILTICKIVDHSAQCINDLHQRVSSIGSESDNSPHLKRVGFVDDELVTSEYGITA